jgi:hypothetical protein
MSYYNPEVKIALDELCSLKTAANCLSIVRKERDDAKAATAKASDECAEAIYKMKAELNAANEAAGKLRKELDEKSATIPAFPKMSEELAASFDRATKAINDAENPPPLVATPDREMILGVLKDIVHNVAVYFTKPQTTEEEPF